MGAESVPIIINIFALVLAICLLYVFTPHRHTSLATFGSYRDCELLRLYLGRLPVYLWPFA